MIQHQSNPWNSKSEKQRTFKGKPYYLIGMDILIDENLKAWMLEINDRPSFSVVCCQEPSASCAHEACPISRVDLYVKQMVVTDTLNLMLKSRKGKINDFEDRFKSMTRVYPLKNSEHKEIHDTVKGLRDYFYWLTGHRD